MSRLSPLAVVHELAEAVGPHFHEAARSVLEAAIPSDIVAWIKLDLAERRAGVAGIGDQSLTSRFCQGLEAVFPCDPIIRTYVRHAPMPPPLRMSDVASDREWFSNPSYREAFNLLAARRTLSVVVDFTKDPAGVGWMFLRSGRDFTDDEVVFVRTVQTALATLERLSPMSRASVPTLLPARASEDELLTKREREVVVLTAEGWSSFQVGHGLGISARTVEKHLQNAYRKLGAHERVGAIRAARARSYL